MGSSLMTLVVIKCLSLFSLVFAFYFFAHIAQSWIVLKQPEFINCAAVPFGGKCLHPLPRRRVFDNAEIPNNQLIRYARFHGGSEKQ